jgi:WD40 repeat protein
LNSTFNHHKNVVSSIQWHPYEYNILLSGSYDKNASVFDPRDKNKVKLFNCKNEIESAKWDLHQSQLFSCSLENGYICSFDFRYEKNPLFNFKAHDKNCNDIQYHPKVKNLLVSASEDNTIKLWQLKDKEPKLLKTKKSNYGPVFTLDFSNSYDDESTIMAAAGNKSNILIFPNFEK